MNSKYASILGYPVYLDDLSDISTNGPKIINTLNGHSYNVAKKDPEFKKALLGSDVLLPDGESVVMGAKFLGIKKMNKVAGFDLFEHLMKMLDSTHGSCFFLGAAPATLDKIQKRVNEQFPNVRVGSYSPPYKPVFSAEDSNRMCSEVNAFKPDVLFVGMTAPKQEKWVYENKDRLHANVVCSVGAVFDFFAGTTQRPPQWMIDMKLEWFGRLVSEPKRMWRRYILSTPVFLIDIVKYKFGISSKTNGQVLG